MKKVLMSLFAAATLFTVSTPSTTEAATVNMYEAVVFQDEVVRTQYNYLNRTDFLRAVSQNQFTNGISYTHLKLPTGDYYNRTEYLKYLGEAYKKGLGFAAAIQDLADNGRTVTNVTFVKGKMENGKVIAAEEPQVREFKVIDIK